MFYAIVCTACKTPHFDINEDNVDIEVTRADEHGAWESGKGETIEAAKQDALRVAAWARSLVE